MYYGCVDLNLPTPVVPPIEHVTIKPEITFSDLHPYASYTARVTAHEVQSSYSAEITFNTNRLGTYTVVLFLTNTCNALI